MGASEFDLSRVEPLLQDFREEHERGMIGKKDQTRIKSTGERVLNASC